MLSQEDRDRREAKRKAIIARAVNAAERVILGETDGSNETLMWLTLQMATVYQDKAMLMIKLAAAGEGAAR
jgi:hypothetical protein